MEKECKMEKPNMDSQWSKQEACLETDYQSTSLVKDSNNIFIQVT